MFLLDLANFLITRHSMPSLPSLYSDHSLTSSNGHVLLCKLSLRGRSTSIMTTHLQFFIHLSSLLDSNSFYIFSAKNASKCRKTLSNGNNIPNPLIQDPTTPDLYQGEDGLKLSILFYHRLHSYEVFSGVSLACCCIYWAGLIALICRSQRYWWL